MIYDLYVNDEQVKKFSTVLGSTNNEPYGYHMGLMSITKQLTYMSSYALYYLACCLYTITFLLQS